MDKAPKAVDEVVLEIKGTVAVIRINQPKKLGALSQDLFFNLSQVLRHVDSRDDVFVTVLAGTGRFFSAYVSMRRPIRCFANIGVVALMLL